MRNADIISGRAGGGDKGGDEGRKLSVKDVSHLLKDGGHAGGGGRGGQGGADEGSGVACREDYAWAEGALNEALVSVRKGAAISVEPFTDRAGQFIERLKDGDSICLIAYAKKTAEYDIAQHSINVAILSLKVGMGHALGQDELTRLGTAALLHDLGMASVPEEIFLKPGSLSHAERKVIQEHPVVSYNAVREAGGGHEAVADAVLSVHERCSGGGYPKGLTAEAIPELAKILGVVDMYEALTHPRPFRKGLLPIDALKEILQTARECFPVRVFKSLVDQLTTYPTGTYVRLNSGEVGRVVETNRFAPLRPRVVVLFDASGRRNAEERMVDLSRSPILFVVETVFEEDLEL